MEGAGPPSTFNWMDCVTCRARCSAPARPLERHKMPKALLSLRIHYSAPPTQTRLGAAGLKKKPPQKPSAPRQVTSTPTGARKRDQAEAPSALLVVGLAEANDCFPLNATVSPWKHSDGKKKKYNMVKAIEF